MKYVMIILLTGCGATAESIEHRASEIRIECRPGCDFAAAINAADRVLGTRRGRITTPHGDRAINSTIMLSTGHSLWLGAGTYLATNPIHYATFLLSDNTELIGMGRDKTIILEPPSYVVVNTVKDFAYGGNAGNVDISIRDLEIRGRSEHGGVAGGSVIALGNARRIRIERVRLRGLHAIGIQAGGGSVEGHHGADVVIKDSEFRDWPGIAVAVTNADDVRVTRNTFDVWLAVDLEPNSLSDTIANFSADHNKGFGLVVQGIYVGPGVVRDNEGGGFGVFRSHDFLFENNNIGPTPPGRNGVYFGGARDCIFRNNHLVNVGGPGGWPVAVNVTSDVGEPTTGLLFEGNTIRSPDRKRLGSGVVLENTVDGVISDYNEYLNNRLGPGSDGEGGSEPPRIMLMGPHSIMRDNIFETLK